MNEADYLKGNRAAWSAMLDECLRRLGYEDPESQKTAWISEREAAIAQLRMVCEDHGDNDWDESLHLEDIIEKHLYKHLESE